MRESNPPANPELLDALAKSFIESGYDLKQLIRTIALSTTYQLSALPNAHNGVDRQNFSRYYPKRLQAEVLLDAINASLNTQSSFEGMPVGTHATALPDNSFNSTSYFLTVFGRPEGSSACECERSQESSLAQSLHLINSPDLQKQLTADQARPALHLRAPSAARPSNSDNGGHRRLHKWQPGSPLSGCTLALMDNRGFSAIPSQPLLPRARPCLTLLLP
jgi:hypothetical protein